MDVRTLAEIPPWEWPPGADELIVEVLRDRFRDEHVRLLAAELAGSHPVVSEELATALLELFGSPDESDELRGHAAISLGPVLEDLESGFYDDEPEDAPFSGETERAIRTALRDGYRDGELPKYVRRRALEASARAPEAWHPGAVRAAYHSGDEEWRRTAVFCMGYVPGFADEILDALESDDLALVYDALQAARSQGVRGAWPKVRSLLRSPGTDRELLLMAISAVVTVRPEGAYEALDPFLDSEDEEVAHAARYALELVEAFDDELFDDEGPDGPDGPADGGEGDPPPGA